MATTISDSGPAPALASIPVRAMSRLSLVFTLGLAACAALTAAATGLAVFGPGPIGQSGALIWGLLFASLGLAAVLGAALVMRILQIASARGAPEAGARLHLRFVGLFSLAAVAPVVVLAGFLGLALGRGLDQWFSERVRTSVENSASFARAYVTAAVGAMENDILPMAQDIDAAAAQLARDPDGFDRFLVRQALLSRFQAAYIIDRERQVLARAEAPQAPGYVAPSDQAFIDADTGAVSVRPFEDTDTLRALYRLNALNGGYVYVARFADKGMLGQLRQAEQAVEEYREAERRRGAVQNLFALAYLSTALLVLLGAGWLGLSNASRIVEPIGRMAEAAGRVAAGDLSARVPLGPERDEVDALGRAFNRMTAQLEAQRTDLVSARLDAEFRSSFIGAVLSGVSAGVIGLNAEGVVTVANRSAKALLNIDGALEGQNLAQAAPEFSPVLRAADDEKIPTRVDIVRGGATTHLSIRRATAPDGAGVVLTFDDMTKLVAAQRQEAWKDVARRIAHEIKNPLTPIQLSAERLRRKYAAEVRTDPDIFQRCVDTILRQVSDIGRMVDEFSAFARMPAPKPSFADIAEVARAAAFAQRLTFPDIRFDVDSATTPVEVWCDERLIAQALVNVMKNAGEAIQARRAKEGEPKEGLVQINIQVSPQRVVIDVMDNGVGLPAHGRAELLEPYVTTRAKGTGLGLAIVRRVLEDHGGAIELHDAPAPLFGAMVRFLLPRAGAAPADDSAGREN